MNSKSQAIGLSDGPFPNIPAFQYSISRNPGVTLALKGLLDMPALPCHDACAMKRRVQYTLRNVPERTDALLRETAAEYGTSLNEAALAALMRGLGAEADAVEHHDLDALIGSWVQDPACDRALADMDKIDAELWT